MGSDDFKSLVVFDFGTDFRHKFRLTLLLLGIRQVDSAAERLRKDSRTSQAMYGQSRCLGIEGEDLLSLLELRAACLYS